MTPAAPRPRRARRRAPALVTALVPLLLAACGGGARTATDDPGLRPAAATAPATTAATPVATTAAAPIVAATVATAAPTTPAPTVPPAGVAPVTTAEPTTLPTPIAPPPEYQVEETEVVGTISLPRLGLELDMFEGITLPTLDRGPGHWPGTAMPGQVGNVVVAGHRVSSNRPFRNIDKLVEGDEVVFTVAGTSHTYVVTGHEIVTPDAMRIVAQTPAKTATLFACHPPGSAEYRWVTYLKLAGT